MSKQEQGNSSGSVGARILVALTEQEISQLLDALFSVLPSETFSQVLAQLQADTQETVQQILTPSQTVGQTTVTEEQPVSLAKLAKTWSGLWQEWNEIIYEAAQEEGQYIQQEESWEEPYFDNNFYQVNKGEESEKTLLRYYQQTAQALGQTERMNALEIQQIAFEHRYDWSVMFKAFGEVPVSNPTRQALFQSWRDYINEWVVYP
jgi:hypothetical protein